MRKATAKNQKLVSIGDPKGNLFPKGISIYRIPMKLFLKELTLAQKEKYHVSWFAELTNHCVC
jgi:hypothetical protein